MQNLFSDIDETGIETLHQSNAMVFDVLESITDGFFFVNNNWKVLYWNKAAEKIMSVDATYITGKNLWDVYPDAKDSDFYHHYQTSKRDNVSVEFEITYEKQNLWLHVKTYPSKQGLAVYFKDNTFNKKLSLEVEKAKLQQQVIIDATTDSIWSIDKDFQLIIANNVFKTRLKKATGVDIKTGDNVLNKLPEHVKQQRQTNYERALKGETFIIEDKLKDVFTGKTIYLEINFNPIKDEKEQVVGVACFAKDITERRQQEELIKEQNARLEEQKKHLQKVSSELENVMNSSLDLICAIDKEGRFVHLNGACKELLEYEPSELLGTNFIDLVHSEDLEQTLAINSEVVDGGTITNFRNRFVTKSGKAVHIMWSARWDEYKNLMYSVGRDASSIVEAEILRAQTERKFSALIQKGADMIAILDETGRYTYISPNVEQISGYPIEQFLELNPLALIHPDDLEVVHQQLQTLHQSGQGAFKHANYRVKDSTGNYKWMETIGTNLIEDPAVKGIVINSRDITGRKLQEEELRTSNERFQTVLNITNEVIWDWNLRTGKIKKNYNYTEEFGYTDLEYVTTMTKWDNRIHEDDFARVSSEMLKIIETVDTTPWKIQYRYYKTNGEIADVIDRGLLITDATGQPIRMVGTMQDITERIKIENERELIIEELTTSNNDLKQFSFITSHNLRAPLSNILGILNVIDSTVLDPTNKQLFGLLQSCALQLKETIQDLSDIIVIRNRNVEAEVTNLETTFNDVRKIYLNTLHDIPYQVEADFQLKDAVLNKAYLESIFINLLSNAVKYRSQNRVLKITIKSFINEKGDCEITFSDNGIGLDTQRLKNRVFGMYQRFHENIEGKGLGLFIVKSQVTAMGGNIDLISELDQGTTFIITLPIKK